MTAPGAGRLDRSALPLPPFATPGTLEEFMADPLAVFRRGYEEHGPIFAVQLGPTPGVVLVGPEHHEFFFREVDQSLSLADLYRFVVPMFGEVLLAVPDRVERRRQVSFMHKAFEAERLESYVAMIDQEVDQWLAGLGGNGSFDTWTVMEEISMNVAARTLLGSDTRQTIDAYRPLLADLARGMDYVLPPDLPLERFRRRDEARRQLTELIRPELERRRRDRDLHRDFLQDLVDETAPNDDETLVGIALCTLFTGYITTAAQMSWALVALLQHPEFAAEVVDEVSTAEDLRHCTRLAWALKEAQRLHPVMSHYARTATDGFSVNGFGVPRGWQAFLCPSLAHRLPQVFADPDRYDPTRFGPERQEDQRPYSLIGFSGGFYRCPGAAFGTLEMQIVIGKLLRSYAVELIHTEPDSCFDVGVIRPSSPCTIAYKRR